MHWQRSSRYDGPYSMKNAEGDVGHELGLITEARDELVSLLP
jgi:hypothetical protein